ncbi:hypothetical protein AOLI_G00208900 [Acnodon oligacanthus]
MTGKVWSPWPAGLVSSCQLSPHRFCRCRRRASPASSSRRLEADAECRGEGFGGLFSHANLCYIHGLMTGLLSDWTMLTSVPSPLL